MQFPENWKIPSFDIVELAQKRHNYAICVFVINEGDKFRQQIQEMKPVSDDCDIIIADGGSNDGSTSPEFLEKNHVITLLTKSGTGKLSAQMRMAFAYALKKGYEGIITVDGNHKDDTSAMPLFISSLDSGFDHIQGSRFIRGGKAINTPPLRWLSVRLIHAPLISLAAGFHYTDSTNGFRAYSRKLLLDPKVAPFRDVFVTYELHYYLAVQAARLGYRVKEVPVTRTYPKTGRIPTKISPIGGNINILKILIYVLLGKYNP
jgi:dolichol-phosphate mannosyltransferase